MAGQWLQQGGNVRQSGAASASGPHGSQPPSVVGTIPYSPNFTFGPGSPVIDADGTVFFTVVFNSKPNLRAIDANGEELLWSPWTPYLPSDSFPYTPAQPSLDSHGNIYMLGYLNLYVLAPDGTTSWSYGSNQDGTFGQTNGSYPLPIASPVIDDTGTIYCCSREGTIRALTRDGASNKILQQLWKISCGSILGGPSLGSVTAGAVKTDFVYYCVATQLTAIYRTGANAGQIAWTYDALEGTSLISAASVGIDGTLYIAIAKSVASGVPDAFGIVALTPGLNNAKLKWASSMISDAWLFNPPAISPLGNVFVSWLVVVGDSVSIRVAELNLYTGKANHNSPHVVPASAGLAPIGQPTIGVNGTCYIGSNLNSCIYAIGPGNEQAFSLPAPAVPVDGVSTYHYAVANSLAIGPEGTVYALLLTYAYPTPTGGGSPLFSGAVASWGVSLFIFHVDCNGKQITVQWADEENSGAAVCHLINASGAVISSQTGTKRSGLGYETTFEVDLSTVAPFKVQIVDDARISAIATVITEAPTLTECAFDDPILTVNWSNPAARARRMILELTPVSGNGRTRRIDLGPSSPDFVEIFLPRTVQYQATLRAATRISFGPISNPVIIAGRWLPAPTVVTTTFPSATAYGDRTLAGTVALTGDSAYAIKIYATSVSSLGDPLPNNPSWNSPHDLVTVTNGQWSTQAPAGQYFQASLVEIDYTGNPVAPTMPSVGMGAVTTSALIAGRLPQLTITQRPFQTGGMLAGAVIDLDTMAPASEATYWILVTYQPVSGLNSGQWCPASSWRQGFQGYCSIADDGTWALTFPKAAGAVSAASFAALLVSGPAGATAPPSAYTGYQSSQLPAIDYQNVLGVAIADPIAGSATMTLPPYSDGGITAGRIDYIAPLTSEVVILASSSASGPWQQANPVQCIASFSGDWATNVSANNYYAAVVTQRRTPNSPPLTYTALPTPDQRNVFAVIPALAAATRPQSRALALTQTNQQKPQLQYMAVTALPLDTPVFSIECWVRPILPGCLVSYGPAAPVGSGLILEVLEQGVVRLRLMASNQTSLLDLKSNATDMLDGSWHHVAVARSLLGVALYIDGKLATSQEWTASKNANQRLVSAGSLYLGANGALSSAPTNPLLGALGELRVWTRTIEPQDILNAMYQRLTGPQPGLLGHWNFDNGSCADSSGNHYDGKLTGSPYFSADAVTLVRPGEPYLTTQAVLMEDYAGSSTSPQEITAYRIVVKAHSGDTSAMQCAVQIAVVPPDLELPQDASDIPTPPAYPSGTIIVQGASGFLTPTATLAAPYTMITDFSGELSFCLQADSDYLFAPLVKVRTSFMGQDEWMVISPDRQLHGQMTTLTGGQLNQMVAKSTDETPKLDAEGAEAVARAVRNLAAIAGEHDLESSHPMVRSVNNSQQISMISGSDSQSDNQDEDTAQPPFERRYQNGLVTRDAYMPMSNVIAPDLVTGAQSVARIASAEAMSDKDFMVTWDEMLQKPVFSSDATLIAQEKNQAAAVKLADDPLTLLLLSSPADAPISRDAYVAALRASAGPHAIGFGSFRGFLKKAKGFAVSTIKKVIKGTKRIVSHVVIEVKNALNEFERWVVTTAEQAIGAIQGLLERIGVKIKEVIAFFRQVFAWGDVLATQAVFQTHLEAIFPAVKQSLEDLRGNIGTWFQSLQTKVDAGFTELDTQLGEAAKMLAGQSLQRARTNAAASGPLDVRSNYLRVLTTRTITNDQFTTSYKLPTAAELAAEMPTLFLLLADTTQSVGSSLETYGAAIEKSGLLALFTNPQALFTGSIGVLLEGVRSVLGLVQSAVDAGIQLVAKVADKLIAELITLLNKFDQMLKAHVQIPIVTTLYEKVITRGRSELSVYSLVALLGATPCTIIYKLIHRGQAPTVMARTGHMSQKNALVDASNTSPAWWPIVSYCGGFALVAVTAVQGLIALVNDVSDVAAAGLPTHLAFTFVSLLVDLASVLLCWPFEGIRIKEYGDPLDGCLLAQWVLYLLEVGIDYLLQFGSLVPKIGHLLGGLVADVGCAIVDFTSNLAMLILGFFIACEDVVSTVKSHSAAAFWIDGVFAGVSNFASCLTGIVQILKLPEALNPELVSREALALSVMLTDAFGYSTWGEITAARTVVAMVKGWTFHARHVSAAPSI